MSRLKTVAGQCGCKNGMKSIQAPVEVCLYVRVRNLSSFETCDSCPLGRFDSEGGFAGHIVRVEIYGPNMGS